MGNFDYKYSSGSLRRHKPDPYSIRNLALQLLRKGHNKMIYVGNNTGDVEFTLNATDIINFPLLHDIDMEKVDIVPVLIQRDAIYPDDMPIHARFADLKGFEKFLRELTNK